jgi:hypothetical protein
LRYASENHAKFPRRVKGASGLSLQAPDALMIMFTPTRLRDDPLF